MTHLIAALDRRDARTPLPAASTSTSTSTSARTRPRRPARPGPANLRALSPLPPAPPPPRRPRSTGEVAGVAFIAPLLFAPAALLAPWMGVGATIALYAALVFPPIAAAMLPRGLLGAVGRAITG